MIDRIKASAYFQPIKGQIDALLRPETFVGRAPAQVQQFVEQEVRPALAKYQQFMTEGAEVRI